MLAYGPLAIAVAVDEAFEGYTSGVFLDSGATDVNHAVTLVGWQDDATVPTGGYWILRNQWGTGWGESGYMRIAYGANQVGYGAMWATTAATPPSPPPPPAPPVPQPPASNTYPVSITAHVAGPLGRNEPVVIDSASVTIPVSTMAAEILKAVQGVTAADPFQVLTSIRVFATMRAKGYTADDIAFVRENLTGDVIDTMRPPESGGSIVAEILAFLESPAGEAFIIELIQLFMGSGS
jgi:hypothetical protein